MATVKKGKTRGYGDLSEEPLGTQADHGHAPAAELVLDRVAPLEGVAHLGEVIRHAGPI